MKRIPILFFATVLTLLGCASKQEVPPTPKVSAGPPPAIQEALSAMRSADQIARNSVNSRWRGCDVKVLQDGKELVGTLNGRTKFLDIASRPFRIEVQSVDCDPSIGIILKYDEFLYAANNPSIATNPYYVMAGSVIDNDILFFRSENPRPSPDEGISKQDQENFQKLCIEFARCPLVIRAFRTYWNFRSGNDVPRTFAEFKRLTKDKALKDVKGDIPLIVYTKVKNNAFVNCPGNFCVQTFQTHPFVLRFK